MNTKLTLSIDYEIIEKVKKYAKDNGRSVSDIVENYLRTIVEKNTTKKKNDSPIVNSLRGSFHAPESFDYKEELRNNLAKKYLQNG